MYSVSVVPPEIAFVTKGPLDAETSVMKAHTENEKGLSVPAPSVKLKSS